MKLIVRGQNIPWGASHCTKELRVSMKGPEKRGSPPRPSKPYSILMIMIKMPVVDKNNNRLGLKYENIVI
jgi:hypothetical protein